MGKIDSFEELDCWKASRDVRMFVSKLMKKFPREELYLLTAQMKNASRSATHNIAEGFGRYHYLDNAKFCRISRGSLTELVDQLITASDDEYITKGEYEQGRLLIDKAIKLLNGYISYLVRANKNKSIEEPEIQYTSNN